MTLAGWMPLPFVIPLLVLATWHLGSSCPTRERAMQPLPEIAGAAGAAMGCIQIAMGAAASGLVATLYASLDDRPDGPVLSLGAGGVSVVRPPLGVRRAALNRIALRFSGSASPRANEYNFVLRREVFP
jgi:hypothetical protein